MIGANTTMAKYCAELNIAHAVPRSLAGNQAATTLLLAENAGDSARSTKKRNANNA